LFMARVMILDETAAELDKYLDVPAFAVGDLFYIQKLVMLIENPVYGFSITVTPDSQTIKASESADYAIQIQPSGGFTKTVNLSATNPSSELDVTLSSTAITPPGGAILTLTDLHTPSFTDGIWYDIMVTATGDNISHTARVELFVNTKQLYLPVIQK
ncbi:MAG: hypothetical protein GY796_07840, partial [Chloroflexi bacterium]|nr:hypothetical protein [Chloroflexota bacterium]